MAKLDIPLTKYFSPCFQFDRFRAIREQYGDKEVLTQKRFQKEREAWIAACAGSRRHPVPFVGARGGHAARW